MALCSFAHHDHGTSGVQGHGERHRTEDCCLKGASPVAADHHEATDTGPGDQLAGWAADDPDTGDDTDGVAGPGQSDSPASRCSTRTRQIAHADWCPQRGL